STKVVKRERRMNGSNLSQPVENGPIMDEGCLYFSAVRSGLQSHEKAEMSYFVICNLHCLTTSTSPQKACVFLQVLTSTIVWNSSIVMASCGGNAGGEGSASNDSPNDGESISGELHRFIEPPPYPTSKCLSHPALTSTAESPEARTSNKGKPKRGHRLVQ
ncbi:hypothetical protein GOP47_0006347, partial [Adiantum capillus-veneris]